VARETPLEPAARLSRRLRHAVLLKREDLQPVFSYKIRGAHNRIAHMTMQERARGVVAASAGNHAQGVAYSARHLGIRAVIVMPQTTPEIKVEAVRELGAEVVLAGDSYADSAARAEDLAAEQGLTLVHPFDDPLVIAGQGTIGAEIVRQSQGRVSAVFVPVGGGGLIAGVAGYVKALLPHVRVIGVEPFEADAMYQSLAAGRRVHLDHVGLFADGVAVREVGGAHVRAGPGPRGRGRAREQRRGVRGHQGRLRRHAQRHGAGGRAVRGRPEVVGGRPSRSA
jgi:threonine dehydratase